MVAQTPNARRYGIFRASQKRRLSRQSSLVRSKTTPHLQSVAVAASEPIASAVTRGVIGAGLGLVKVKTPPGLSHSAMDLNELQPPDLPFAFLQTAASSSPKTASLPTATSQGKKKFGLFTLKSAKDNDRSESSYDLGLTSPLPPLTPSKAKQLLGVSADDAGLCGERLDLDSPSRPNAGVKHGKLAEHEAGVEPPPKKSSFWSGGSKALRMLDMRPRQTKLTADEDATTFISWPISSASGEAPSSRNFGLHPQRTLDTPREGQDKIRRRRKKGPKMLEKMTPITEMSHDGLNFAYRNSAHNTELDVISEYEATYPSRSASRLPQSQAEAMLHGHGQYHTSQGSGFVVGKPRNISYGVGDHMMHPGREIDLNELRWKPSDTSYWRSPLQQIEDRLLDEAEEDLIIQEVNIGRHQAAKIDLDLDVEALKMSHETMRHDFSRIEQHVRADVRPTLVKQTQASDCKNDVVSVGSSIDVDEEPTVCVAQIKHFTNVTGKVKPVFITRRRRPTMPIGKRFENTAPVSPTHLRSPSYNRLTKAPRSKMPRNESQLLVQDWISNYDRMQQRPLSERIDPDVLADQEIPPAPFPKEKDYPISPHPPRTSSSSSSSRHYCLHHGHLFRLIHLKDVPDEASINSLGVRPYFQTRSGVRQHVRVPVSCSRCGEDVNEEVWECEIAVCRMAVCGACAREMEREWKRRAGASWGAS